MRSILTALCIVMSVAGSAKAEMLDMAGATGSERLINFTAKYETARSNNLPALKTFVESSARLGFNALDRDKGIHGLRRTYVNLSPTLNFDANANGGNSSEVLDLGGAMLRFDAHTVAQGAMMAGAAIASGTRLFYGRGRYADVNASAGRSFGLGERLVQQDTRLSICSRNHLTGWSFLDLCASNAVKEKRLSTSDQSGVELGLSQLALIAGRPTELKLKLFRQDSSGSWNSGYGAQVLTVIGPDLAVDIAADAELSSAMTPFESYNVAASIHTKIAKRPISVRLAQSEMTNLRILGKTHDDTRRSINFITAINRKINVNLGYSQTRSPIRYFDTDQFGLTVTFSGNLIESIMQ